MNRIILIFLISIIAFASNAQYPGNANDWVEYDKTYYRFSIDEDGIYRLMKSDLLNAGLQGSELVGSQFKMIRNGAEVPLYVSTNGTFGDNDFIEFLGKRNDGEADTHLYADSFEQPSTTKSLFNPNSIHFLTLDSSGNNLRINAVDNDLTNLPTKEEYYYDESVLTSDIYRAGVRYKVTVPGASLSLYESHFSEIEGFNYLINRNSTGTYNFEISEIYQGVNTPVKVAFKVASLTDNVNDIEAGNIQIKLGNSANQTTDIPGTFSYTQINDEFDLNELSNPTLQIKNNSGAYIYIPEITITYPSTFKLDRSFDYINLDKQGSRYLEITDLPSTEKIVVYDLSSLERISENIASITKIRTTSNSTSNDLVYDVDISTPTFVNALDLNNYLEGNDDFIVIYHPELETPINGENYVDKFIDFKESEIGDGWNIKKVNINQIIDQYAYGVHGHSAAIKNYVQELKQLNKLPKHVLLIGKGYEYTNTRDNEISTDYIPTFGHPASDSQLVADYGSNNEVCSVGRISAIDTEELKMYVDKVIEYQTLMSQTSDAFQTKDKLWMKNSMHLGGGINEFEQNYLKSNLQDFEDVITEDYFGAKVSSFFKQSTNVVDETESESIDSLINNGLALINYFGHSSTDFLEFSITDVDQYENQGKYPFMLTNGCLVGDIFQSNRSLSEKFLFQEQKGTLSFMGPTQYGIASGMKSICDGFYNYFVKDEYGISIGEAVQNSIQDISSNSLFINMTKQQMVFHGDPSLSLYKHEKPDYLITTEDVSFEPNNITAETEEFKVNVVITNIGKALNEPVDIQLTRTLPNGSIEVFTQSFDNVYYQDTLVFDIQTNILESAGVNQFNVSIDPSNQLDEITRANNNLSSPITRAIIENTVSPLFPSEFGITNEAETELIAYANVFSMDTRNFEIQIDTTQLFNSNLLQTNIVNSNGGVIKWVPDIAYQDEQVYYWRVKTDEADAMWSNSSFVYIQDYEYGWNQSHYFQYLEDDFDRIRITDDRIINFDVGNKILNIRTGQEIPSNQLGYSIDGVSLDRKRCFNVELAAAIFDKNSGAPEENYSVGGGYGRFNSRYCRVQNKYAFYYDVNNQDYRKDFMDMLDEVEEGDYVLIYSLDELNPTSNDWEGDTSVYGYNIFDKLEEYGADLGSQITEVGAYVYYFQKGNDDFEHKAEFVEPLTTNEINENLIIPALYSQGNLISTTIGPAEGWDEFQWNWNNSLDENPDGDQIVYSIIGIRNDDTSSVIFEDRDDLSLDISNINASEFPQLKVEIKFLDETNYTPPQLEFFRVVYDPLPELALNVTDLTISSPHQYAQHEAIRLDYEIENIFDKDMTPVLVEYSYSQAQGGQTTVEERYEELLAGQKQTIEFDLNTSSNEHVGNNLLFIDVNPNNDQPEQFHFNNIASIEFDLKGDNENPFLDVTFDGIQIINGDLVAKTPEIIITLTDENEFIALDDPDDFEIYVQHPNRDTLSVYTANSPEINFFPADSSNLEEENKAVIEFRPDFVPGNYEMRVQAVDKTNNKAGENDYLITFEVVDEDIITQIINYPNPFTTSTEFIAKIVGDAPDEVLIQIFTPNGKVIRELHSFGTDIELSQGNSYYRVAHWDGTDTFGDPVANGVYFYKITMKRGGEIISAYDESKYSEYFHDGIGKLYILR